MVKSLESGEKGNGYKQGKQGSDESDVHSGKLMLTVIQRVHFHSRMSERREARDMDFAHGW